MDVDLCVGTVGMSVWFSKDLGESWTRRRVRRVSTRSAASGPLPAMRRRPATSTPAATRACTAGTRRSSAGRTCPRRWTADRCGPLRNRRTMRACCLRVAGRPRSTARTTPDDVAADRHPIRGVMRAGDLVRGRRRSSSIPTTRTPSGSASRSMPSTAAPMAASRGRGTTRAWGRSTSMASRWSAAPQGAKDRTIYVTTDQGPHRSRDNGESWEQFELPSPWQYTRAVDPTPGQ